ncbi:GDSL-type esterase/lipase family protein [Mucilaginibacter sp.]|uniref:arylesterase n=1 Tax=Mucilaginibacter sp. TaxID=1882438 RepID=UPI00285149BD|nr:GDSL-type esterase/lipase family protein [Mucilaginibacter sp.]MDR3696000.1 GDSL-type esterase/lipase family protein [Mucilaginibacter sp.]
MNLQINPFVISNDSEKSYTSYAVHLTGFIRSLFSPRRNSVFIISILLLSACGSKQSSTTDNVATSTKPDSTSSAKTVLFFGDSLTAGYGLDDQSQAFPAVVQSKIDSVKLPYHVVNAGVSGETSAGGRGRINWILKQRVDVFVLELGANDGLRGIPVSETTANLQAIIDAVKTKYPKARLVMMGMQVPPNMGNIYAYSFKAIFPELAAKNKMILMPFLLKDVAGNPKLNQKDGIHPTAEGAKIVGGNVWEVLHGVLLSKN